MATFDRNPDTIRMTQHADTVTNLRFRHSRAKPFNKPTFETDVVFVVWHNSHGDSDIFEIDTRSHHLNGRSWGRASIQRTLRVASLSLKAGSTFI